MNEKDKYKILVVDDSSTNLELITHHLKSDMYEIITACSGKEALKVTGLEKFNLILIDILMPEMDGFELCKSSKMILKQKIFQ